MEGLTQLSTSIFQSTQQFANPSPNRRLIAFEIAVIDRVGHFRRTEVAETDLEHWGSTDAVQPSGTSWPPTSTFEASFKLVCIERSLIISLNVSKDGFYRLLDVMEADPAVFYPICQDYDGFHEFPGGSCHRPTWFFGTSIHAILWTFDQTVKPARTVAIYFRRRRQSFNAFANFGEALRAFCNHAAAWQMTLLVIIVHSIHWFDETTLTNLNQIRRIVGCTGFGPQTLIPPYRARRDARTGKESYFSANNFDIDTLMEFSQGVNEVAGNLSNKLRHLRVLQTMLERLKIDAAQELTPSSPITNCFCPSAVESRRNLNTAVPAIMVRLTTQAEYLAYLRDRSERLSAVVSLSGVPMHAISTRISALYIESSNCPVGTLMLTFDTSAIRSAHPPRRGRRNRLGYCQQARYLFDEDHCDRDHDVPSGNIPGGFVCHAVFGLERREGNLTTFLGLLGVHDSYDNVGVRRLALHY
jgi:hypothetical protein